MPSIYVLHENSTWVAPLVDELAALGVPFEEWFLDEGSVDLDRAPPEGVFYNRMSASSHTRDHRYAVELTESVLAWLEAHDRRVLNDARALHLEVRKFEQGLRLRRFGLHTPATHAAVGRDAAIRAAKSLGRTPFIVKPNRGGKGTGVELFGSVEAFAHALDDRPATLASLDGVLLVQEYVPSVDGAIVRMEFIGGRFHYAVRVDTAGSFALCPADACQVGDTFCPTTPEVREEAAPTPAAPSFTILEGYDNPDIPRAEAFLEAHGIAIGAIEYAVGPDGRHYHYDVNTNTNYNAAAEARHGGVGGMRAIARLLAAELGAVRTPVARRVGGG